jgi:hypothetical protein
MSDGTEQVEEPGSDYGKKRITFFNSFEEAEQFSLTTMANHTHLERLQNLTRMRSRLLGPITKEVPRVITIFKADMQ